jgi:hypothetical protein
MEIWRNHMEFLWEHQILVEITQFHKCLNLKKTTWLLALKDRPIDPNIKPWHRAFPWVWSWSSSHYQLIDSATTYMHILKSKALFIDQSIDDPNTIV